MSVWQLLTRLRELDVKPWVEVDKLRYSAPQGVLTDDWLSERTSNKKVVTEWLNKAVIGNRLNVSIIGPASQDRDLPASYSQELLLFLEQLVPETKFYNLILAAHSDRIGV